MSSIGRGARFVVIRGEAGIGKSALWRFAVQRHRQAGHRTLVTRASEEELHGPMTGLVDLFEGTDPVAGTLNPDTDRYERGRGVLATLRRLTTEFPVVLAIDATRVVTSAVADFIPRPTMARIHILSGGNPLYAIELARAVDLFDDSLEAPVPPTLLGALSSRVADVPDDVLAILQVAAALGPCSAVTMPSRCHTWRTWPTRLVSSPMPWPAGSWPWATTYSSASPIRPVRQRRPRRPARPLRADAGSPRRRNGQRRHAR